MSNDKRRQALLYIFLTITGTMILGISLSDLQLQPGLPIPGADPDSTAAQAAQPGTGLPGLSFPWVLQAGLALGIILMFAALITALVKKANVRQIGLFAAGLVVLFGIFSRLPDLAAGQLDLPQSGSYNPLQPSFEYSTAPIGDPPAVFLFWAAAVSLLAVLGLIGWLLSRRFQPSQKEDPLAVEAEAAVQAIANGQTLSDVIIRCYLNMESVIAQERGIERGQSVTPREFEAYLVEKGIPQKPVLQLTGLFEKARYGNQRLNQQDEQAAVNCFIAIQNACRPDSGGAR
ncbi:MAG: DUF4129 domain-containing protein [Chloroflexi bacterium]|nr:DUF4129 domain-containing protein [Chloroflexota bacterium]